MLQFIALGNCPTCHGSGVVVSEFAPTGDGSAIRMTARYCECARVSVDVERLRRRVAFLRPEPPVAPPRTDS